MPVKKMTTKYGIHNGSVSKHLREHGVPPSAVGLDAEQIQKAVKPYIRGESLAAISTQMDVDNGTLRQRLVEVGLEMQSPYDLLLH